MVCSWICVSAWNSEMMTPTTRPTSISGADTSTSVTIASRATSRTSGPVIHFSPHPRCDQLSSAHPREGGGPGATGFDRCIWPLDSRVRGNERNMLSDRHPHDFLVGGDHLVAHRAHRLDCDP